MSIKGVSVVLEPEAWSPGDPSLCVSCSRPLAHWAAAPAPESWFVFSAVMPVLYKVLDAFHETSVPHVLKHRWGEVRER